MLYDFLKVKESQSVPDFWYILPGLTQFKMAAENRLEMIYSVIYNSHSDTYLYTNHTSKWYWYQYN